MRNIKKISALFLALIICFACFSNGTVFAAKTIINTATTNNDFAKKTAEIIKNNDDSSMLRIIGRFGEKPSYAIFANAEDAVVSKEGRFVLQFSSEKKLLSCLEELNNNPDIIYAERDVPVYTEGLELGTEYLSWGATAIEADVYSQRIAPSVSDRSVTVAIVDSGCEDIDFIKDKLVPGYDFYENNKDAFQDESVDSHGTFLASIVADCTYGIPVKIMPVRVLGSKEGTIINLINGIIYAVDNGADVINLSLGAVLNNCKALEDAVNYAEENNVSVVVCAGNLKIDIKNFCPAHIDSVLTISSVNQEHEFSESFSNFGDKIDIAAPGESILGYNALGKITTLSGTSMAAAYASAAAAMFRLDNPYHTSKQVHDALNACAEDYGAPGWDNCYGNGVLKLGNIPPQIAIPVESVAFSQSSYALNVGDTLEIKPVFSPAGAADKSFTLSADNGNISINGNIIKAVSPGVTTLTVTSSNGMQDTAIITITEKIPETTATLSIRNNPGKYTINYGETLCLTAEITDISENTSVWWYVDGIKKGEGTSFRVSPESGSVEVTAKLVDANGNIITDKNGNEISDSETVAVKSGFFQKIISFFKNLFRLDRNVVQFIFEK